MLAEERLSRITELVNRQGTATVPELAAALDASESTVRRDLEKLDEAGRVVKVHGGATAVPASSLTRDLTVAERSHQAADEKRAIAAYAATLVGPDDFVYLDAGTTVGAVIDELAEIRASFVTDSVSHAMRLAAKGLSVTVVGGELKSVTEALVGPDALDALARYHFTLGLFGTNGAAPEAGYTTLDRREAQVKQVALEHTARAYVLCDASKLGSTSLVTFAPFDAATLVCDRLPEALAHTYQDQTTVVEVAK